MFLFGRRRKIEGLEYRVRCLEYDLEELREGLGAKRPEPPKIMVNPRIQAEVIKGGFLGCINRRGTRGRDT